MRLLQGAFLLTLAIVLVIALIDVTPVDEPSTVLALACVAAGLAAIVLGLAGLVAWTQAITALNLAIFAPPSALSILLGAVCLILFPLSVYRLGVAVKKRWKKRKA
jgi:drug/metabolite transporter (DMT)-like permease